MSIHCLSKMVREAGNLKSGRNFIVRLLWISVLVLMLWTFSWTLILTYRFSQDLPARYIAGLSAIHWTGTKYFLFSAALLIVHFITGVVVGVWIYILQPGDRMAVFTSIFLITFGTANSFIPAKEYLTVIENSPVYYEVPYITAGLLSYSMLAIFFALFPNGKFTPGWMKPVAIYGFVYTFLWNLYPETFGSFTGTIGILSLVSVIFMFSASFYAQVWRYRNYSSPVQKQQTKWFVFGLILTFLIVLLPSASLLAIVDKYPGDPVRSVLFDLLITLFNTAFILWPLTIGIAILRYRLWDIDVFIRRTLQYTVLSGTLALVYFGFVVIIQSAFNGIVGEGYDQIVIVFSTLALAALVSPLKQRIQEVIDKRFFRTKYDADLIMNGFSALVRDEIDLDTLSISLMQTMEEAVQPEVLSLWLRPVRKEK